MAESSTPTAWGIQQVGRQLVVELCQFVFLLRLIALVFVLFSQRGDPSTAELSMLGASCLIALVGTYIMHSLVDSARAHPLVVGVDVAVAAAGLYVGAADPTFFVLSLFTAILVGLLYVGVSAVLLLAILVLAFLVASTKAFPVPSLGQIAASVLMYVATYAGGRVVAHRVNQLTEQGIAASRQMSTVQERSRLAREMHDGVVKTLHGIALSAGAIGSTDAVPADMRRRFATFAEAAEFGVRQARETLVELRVDQDDRPYRVVVDDILQRWSGRVGVPVETTIGAVADIDEPARGESLACLREALDNVAEHAEADRVSVSFDVAGEAAVLTVSDDGKGVDQRRLSAAARQGHFGVRGMRERMESVGGDCALESRPGHGTTVRLTIPITTDGRPMADTTRTFRSRSATALVAVVLGVAAAGCTGSSDDPSDGGKGGDGTKAAAPPVLSSFVIDAGTQTPQDVRVAIHGVRRIAGATVLDWSVTPLVSDTAAKGARITQPLDINIDPALDNTNALRLVDTAAKKVYRPLDNDDKVAGCLCVPWFKVKSTLTAGSTRLMQAAFPELPAGLDDITVSIRNQPLVDAAPITPQGQVPTGKGADLAAAADDLPEAAPAQSFVYPVKDALTKPAQKMSLTVNQVLAGSHGTTVVYTVTADAAGRGLSSQSGRPVNDPDVVTYGTSLYDFSSSGPGLAPGGDDSGRLVRSWFASVKQKTGKPPRAADGFSWRECLCSTTQFYGKRLATQGRSLTLVEHMPALPSGTSTTDVVFPDKSLPTVKDVAVTQQKAPEGLSSRKADVGTWTYGSVEGGDLPAGWTLKQWPTPVPDDASVKASEAVVDDLEEVYTDDVSIEKKESTKVEVTLDSTVSFEPDSARLTAKAKKTIARVARDIDDGAKGTILVEGHVSGTDRGSKAVQQRLSEQRAQAVRQALDAAVSADVSFKAVGKGATEPVAPNDTEEHRKLNRRVVISYDR